MRVKNGSRAGKKVKSLGRGLLGLNDDSRVVGERDIEIVLEKREDKDEVEGQFSLFRRKE